MNSKDYETELAKTAKNLSSDDILSSRGVAEYNTSDLIHDFEEAYSYKVEQARVFKILDAADHSDIWKIFNRKIPSYVQTPVHNPITIIKEATKASIMPTSFQGEFRALTLDARDIAETCSKYFSMKWDASDMDAINSEAADYAFLHGTSGVLFGWQENVIDYADVAQYFNPAKHSEFQAKAWHPSNIFPDPTAKKVEEMRYLYFVERKSKAFLKSIARFKDAMYIIDQSNDAYGNTDGNYIPDASKNTMNDTVTFITCYRRVNRIARNTITQQLEITPKVDVIYMAGKNVLDVSPGIEPNIIPFVPLYDEQMPNNFWGISKCYKVLSLVLTLNQLDSIEATEYFKHQNPAEFINSMAGLNVADYQNKRDNPNAAFTVQCDPKLVSAFASRPELPKTLDGFRAYIIEQIANISGIDAAYLGRSYGSVQTTGGVQTAVDRATMRDTNRIKMIDKFVRKEIEIMCQFYMIKGRSESFFSKSDSKDPGDAGEILHFDPQALIGREDISISVSNAAPRSNQSFEDAAMALMELQMKYNPAEKGYADFITPKELISWMNIPRSQQNLILERMNNQQANLKTEEYTAVISAFGQLVDSGVDPQQALTLIAQQVEASKLGQLPAASTGAPMGPSNGKLP